MKYLSTGALWLAIAAVLALTQAFTAFGQSNELIGSWKNGSVGAISYQNRVTGSVKPGRGSLFTYKFLPGGTYEFIGYMEVTMYNCTTTLFNDVKGRYSVNGSTITLSPNRDFWKNTNSCAASGNKTQLKTPKKETVQFEFKNNEYGQRELCITTDTGETCYRRNEN